MKSHLKFKSINELLYWITHLKNVHCSIICRQLRTIKIHKKNCQFIKFKHFFTFVNDKKIQELVNLRSDGMSTIVMR